MFFAPHQRAGGAGILGGFDPAVTAWAAAVVVAGGADPSATRKMQLSTFVAALKASGDWALLDYFYLLAAPDQIAATVCLKDPTRLATWTNSPTHVADRYTQGDNATNKWIDTGFNPTTASSPNYVRNSNALGMFVIQANTNLPVTYVGDITEDDGTNYGYLNSTDGTGNARFPANAAADAAQAHGGTVIGAFQRNRTTSTLTTLYRDGSSLGTSAGASNALLNFSHSIFSYAAGANPKSNSRLAAAWAGGGELSAANMNTNLRTYLTAIGAI